MKTKVCYPGFLLVFIMCVNFTNVSYCIELNPTKEQIEDAIKLGESNPGRKSLRQGSLSRQYLETGLIMAVAW